MIPDFLESADTLLKMWSELKGFVERTRRLLIRYLVIVAVFIVLGWCINIFVGRQEVLWLLLLAIPALFFFLAQKELIISILMGRLLLSPGDPQALWWEEAIRHVRATIDILSSITFVSIWPILILTYLDFSHAPSNFWTAIFALSFLCILDAHTHGRDGKILKFFVFATPTKLMMQLMMTMAKLAGGGNFFGLL